MPRVSPLLLLVAAMGCAPSAKDGPPISASSGADKPDAPKPAVQARLGHFNDSCAPWDGAGLDLVIDDSKACSAPPTANLNFHIWEHLPLTAGLTFHFSSSSHGGSAFRCGEGGKPCTVATSADLVIDTATGDQVTGSYELAFRDGSHLSAPFVASRCEVPAPCGGARVAVPEASASSR